MKPKIPTYCLNNPKKYTDPSGYNYGLRISIGNHLKSLFLVFVITLMNLGVLIWLQFESEAVLVFGVLYIIFVFPAIYLHIEYWIQNYNFDYELTLDEIIERKNGIETRYKTEEISAIFVFISPSLYRNSNLHTLPIEGYHFAIIKMKSGHKIILTSLLNVELYKKIMILKQNRIIRVKKLFCTLDFN